MGWGSEAGYEYTQQRKREVRGGRVRGWRYDGALTASSPRVRALIRAEEPFPAPCSLPRCYAPCLKRTPSTHTALAAAHAATRMPSASVSHPAIKK